MNEPVVTTWEEYDAERHGEQGGNYIFLLKAFGNAPYYAGTAQSFNDRFSKNSRSHKKLFKSGLRTFMRSPFIEKSTDRSHAGFAARWHSYKQKNASEQQSLVWVPTGLPNEEMGKEGEAYWENSVARLVSPRGEDRHAVERRIQVDIMDYYDSLLDREIDWCLPPRSRLVGHGPGEVTSPIVQYCLEGDVAIDARTFFGSLSSTPFVMQPNGIPTIR